MSSIEPVPAGWPIRSNSMNLNLKSVIPKRFRRLKWNELVNLGDYVRNEHRRFELWEGPGGFRADAFVRPIYRRDKSRPAATKK